MAIAVPTAATQYSQIPQLMEKAQPTMHINRIPADYHHKNFYFISAINPVETLLFNNIHHQPVIASSER
jgi:hypothetical protein